MRTLAMLTHYFGQDEARYLAALESDGRRWVPDSSCDVCGHGEARECLVSESSLDTIEQARLCGECVAGARDNGLVVERVYRLPGARVLQ